MAGRTVVVLGGGVGGLVAAHGLRRRLPRIDRVVVVERERRHLYAPSYLWVLNGTRRPEGLARPLEKIRGHGIDLETADVTALDVEKRTVETSGGTLEYDRLVVALGAEMAPEAVPGFVEGALDFYTPDGAAAARDAIGALAGGRVAVLVSRMPYKCPAAPWEAAFLTEASLRRRGIREGSRIDVYTTEPLPMPTAGPDVGRAVVALLEGRGIGFHPERPVERVEVGERRLLFADGTTAEYDVLLGVPAHQAPAPVRSSPLAGPNGWAPVDAHTLAAAAEGVHVIGDAAAVPIPGGKLLPKAGVFAHAEADVVARRIADELAGRVPGATFDGAGACFLEVGDGRAAYASGNFFSGDPPDMTLHQPGRHWHLAKVALEQYWLTRWWW